MLPPLKGWKIPFQGPARNTFIMMPRSENFEKAGRVKVLEQGASNVISAAQKAADEAKAICEKDHGSLHPTVLKEVEVSLKPHLQALMDQLKTVESAGLGDATKNLESKIRCSHVQATDAISKVKVLVPQIMRVQQEKQSEQRDEKLLKEMLASITEKFHAAEDLAEKAEITSAMIEHAGEDLVEAQKAAQQTEESAKQAAAAVKEALTAIGLKLAMLKQFERDQGRLKATDALGTFREKLRVANQKLVPFLAAQETFKAQAEAKYLADELEAKLAPAEVEVDKAEQVAEHLLSFAEAALAAGQAAAEATATPKAKESSSKERDKEKPEAAEKNDKLNELPKPEVVVQATQHASEAAVCLQGVIKLLESKRSNQQVLFSAPMKKVLEKAETRVKNAQRKLERIKVAQKELKERETSIALVSDVQEKMENGEKALSAVKEALEKSNDEQEALKAATKAVRLLEVKRFTAEAGIQAQRSLQEHQQTLQGSLAEIEALKKKAAENKEVSKRKEAQRKVEEAEDRAQQAEKSASDIFNETRVESMSAMEIREAGDKNQQAFKGTMEAVRVAQMMITSLQIEAKNKENATALAQEYAKLQARLRQTEAAVAHCAVLPPAVQAQLQLKAQLDEAEALAQEAEKNPLPQEDAKADDAKPSAGVGVPAPKAFTPRAMPYSKVSPRIVTLDAFPTPPSDGPPPHLLWKAAPKSEMARKSLETQIKQSTSPKALIRHIGVRPPPPPPRPKPSKSAALATPAPELPSRRCILPALSPPPARPVAVEVKTSDKAEQVKEHGQSIWKGAQSATDEILSASAFSAKTPTSTEAHGWSHDLASHNWQKGSWQDWRPWSWSKEQDQFWSSEESSFSNDGAEEKKACLSWTQSYSQDWQNKTLQDEDKPSCQGGWREDWSKWTKWSDWSESKWSKWWDSKEWIQERSKEKDIEERDEERHTDDAKPAKSAEKAPLQDDSIGQWANLLRKWEDEKAEKLKELASSEASCREVDDEDDGLVRKAARPSMSSDMESITEEEDEHEELIKRSREVLQRHRGEAPVQRSGKRGRSPLPQEPPYPPPKKLRRSGKASSKRAKARYAKLDDKRELSKVEVRELRYSQLSCKETFQCGRSVSQLVQDLLDRKVSLSAPFLRLTVFETTDEKTNEPILRCIDNRRLFALKEYAKKSGKDRLMVNVNLFSQNTLTQVQRFIQNSDNTDGRDVRLRRNRNDKRRQPSI
eukprot:symbB.v1.2.027275.t1/scaffold2787.1/size70355/1